MGKIIFWIIVFFVVLFALRLASLLSARSERRKRGDGHDDDAQAQGSRRPPLAPGTPTVRCSRCGVFIPKSEAVLRLGGYRCARPDCTDAPR